MTPSGPPTKLIHYTSADTAAKIIRNKELWLSNARDMNDTTEIEHGWKLLETDNRLRKVIEKHDLATAIPSWKDTLLNNTYFTCFSDFLNNDEVNDGRLSMWRGYGKDRPVGIVFNTAILQSITYRIAYHFRLKKVVYREEEQIQQTLAIIQDHSSSSRSSKLSRTDLSHPLLLNIGFFTKHYGFSEEHEWRLVYNPDLNSESFDDEEISVPVVIQPPHPENQNRKIAKLDLTRISDPHSPAIESDVDYQNLIDSLLIGPMDEEDRLQTRAKLEKALTNSSFVKVDIRHSKIPYRPPRKGEGRHNRVSS